MLKADCLLLHIYSLLATAFESARFSTLEHLQRVFHPFTLDYAPKSQLQLLILLCWVHQIELVPSPCLPYA